MTTKLTNAERHGRDGARAMGLDPDAQEKAQHTPGPWEYQPARNYGGFSVAPRGTLPTLAAVERCGEKLSVECFNFPGDTEANASLIAAAPELLGQLELGRAKLALALEAIARGDARRATAYVSGVREGNDMAIKKARGE